MGQPAKGKEPNYDGIEKFDLEPIQDHFYVKPVTKKIVPSTSNKKKIIAIFKSDRLA